MTGSQKTRGCVHSANIVGILNEFDYIGHGRVRCNRTHSKLQALRQSKPPPSPVLPVSWYRAPVTLHAACSAVAVALSRASDFIIAAQTNFSYLPIVSNPKNNPCIQTVIRIATKI